MKKELFSIICLLAITAMGNAQLPPTAFKVAGGDSLWDNPVQPDNQKPLIIERRYISQTVAPATVRQYKNDGTAMYYTVPTNGEPADYWFARGYSYDGATNAYWKYEQASPVYQQPQIQQYTTSPAYSYSQPYISREVYGGGNGYYGGMRSGGFSRGGGGASCGAGG